MQKIFKSMKIASMPTPIGALSVAMKCAIHICEMTATSAEAKRDYWKTMLAMAPFVSVRGRMETSQP